MKGLIAQPRLQALPGEGARQGVRGDAKQVLLRFRPRALASQGVQPLEAGQFLLPDQRD